MSTLYLNKSLLEVTLCFCGVLVIPLILDLSRIFDPFVKRLGDQAYEKYLYHEELKRLRDEVDQEAFEGMGRDTLHAAIRARLDENDPSNFERISRLSDSSVDVADQSKGRLCYCWGLLSRYWSCCWSSMFPPDEPYSADFFRNVLAGGRFYYGCKVFESDFIVVPYLKYAVRIPVGFREDILLYICNNHTFLSTFLATRGNPRSRSARRLIFFVQMAVFYYCLAITQGRAVKFVLTFGVIVIFPIIDWYFSITTTCYCLYGMETSKNSFNRNLVRFCNSVSFLPTLIGVLLTSVLLVSGTASIPEGASAWPIMQLFFVTIFVAQLWKDFIPISYIFAFGNVATKVEIPCLRLLCMDTERDAFGHWFREMITVNQYTKDVNYKEIKKNLFLFFYEITPEFAERRPRLACLMWPLIYKCTLLVNKADYDMVIEAQAESLAAIKRAKQLGMERMGEAAKELDARARGHAVALTTIAQEQASDIVARAKGQLADHLARVEGHFRDVVYARPATGAAEGSGQDDLEDAISPPSVAGTTNSPFHG